MRNAIRIAVAGLGALGLLASQARADEKIEQKAETKTSRDGKKVKHHREARHVKDTPRGKVTDKASTDAETKTTIGGGTVSTTEKVKDADGDKVKTKTKVERDPAGNVTHTETDVKK